MTKILKIAGIVIALGLLAISWPAYQMFGEIQRGSSEDPLVWEESVSALEARSRGRFAAGEAVVFIGSSSIRFWQTLEQDMSPIPVIQHGFGGSKLNDIVYYAQRLVTNFEPHAVVVFAGTNDITPAASKAPEVLLASYQAFVKGIRREQPDLPVFYIGITPSPLRWEVWPIAQETNRLIRDWVARDDNLYFIDTSATLLGDDGKPGRDNYVFDGLHLSEKGYSIWAAIIRARLIRELDRFAQNS